MPEKRYDLREIARSALNEMPPRDRVPFLAGMLCEVDGPQALALLAQARNAISLHMTSLIDGQMGEDDGKAAGFFDLEAARQSVVNRRRHDALERAQQVLDIIERVVAARLSGGDDQSVDGVAQDLSVLLFRK